jgi:hypothetical protein
MPRGHGFSGSIKIRDATLNALVKLDIFAKNISILIDKQTLDEMECLFNAYFEGNEKDT